MNEKIFIVALITVIMVAIVVAGELLKPTCAEGVKPTLSTSGWTCLTKASP